MAGPPDATDAGELAEPDPELGFAAPALDAPGLAAAAFESELALAAWVCVGAPGDAVEGLLPEQPLARTTTHVATRHSEILFFLGEGGRDPVT
jgi:hypothetical protein